ncbi:MAG: Eco57I restriction-modification methylase domain-containing protein [Gemmataceae bacterium]|nr:Eco57I restriction-modification methylase domain-containing protein [Gemmataceae bacterium]
MPAKVDRIRCRSRSFSALFPAEHLALTRAIEGIPAEAGRAGYAAVLLTRLMFSCFLRGRGALRGGLLTTHELERAYPTLHVPDAALRRARAFLDRYHWRLGDGPATANEVTPEVLGDLFEQPANRKQVGAYYTGDDVSEYIARSTIIPFLLDSVARACPASFAADGPAWRLLSACPDRYLFEPVRLGVDHPLPAEVAAGLDRVTERVSWNRPAADGFALPAETWREHVMRRRRCLELRARLAGGAIHTVNELVTCNLDVSRFAADLIGRDEPELRYAFWHALERLTVLDPTCGSGAFLVAALRVLEPLYRACLDRMEGIPDGTSPAARRSYFVVKSILTRNLYGVDLRPEAIETCKLRLLLELVAQVAQGTALPPLPDLSANVRPGNALVGAVRSPDEARATPNEARLDTPRPFHWFAEFPAIMNRGGFDVILGNPPYVESQRATYRLPRGQYASEPAANLYAFCMERAGMLAAPDARVGMIVPAGLLGLDEARPLREVLLSRYGCHWFSPYAIRPSKLFEGVDQRLCIHLAAPGEARTLHTTRYHHWSAPERPHLFALLSYERSFVYPGLERIPQLGCDAAAGVFAKLMACRAHPLSAYLVRGGDGFRIHYHRSPRYWIRGMDFEPYFQSATRCRSVHHFRDLYARSEAEGKVIAAVLNSSLFYFWFLTVGNGRNLTGADVEGFPLDRLAAAFCREMAPWFDRLMADYRAHSFVRVRQDCAFQEFRPSRSRPILDQIDRLLARHYGFTAEELDFVLNYEIKYRLGREAARLPCAMVTGLG